MQRNPRQHLVRPFWITVFLLSCSAPQPVPPQPVPPQPVSSPTASVDRSARPAPSASPSNTPKPPPYPDEPAPALASVGARCQSSLDCNSGLRCCTPETIDAVANRCDAVCINHEACVPGASNSCRAPLACKPVPGAPSGGACLGPVPIIPCGSVQCGGATAGCCFDERTGKGRCVSVDTWRIWTDDASCVPDVDVTLALCTSPADCPGERCCTAGPFRWTQCAGECASGIDVCSTLADCPEFLGPPTSCRADSDDPPWLKTCHYREGADK